MHSLMRGEKRAMSELDEIRTVMKICAYVNADGL